MTLSELLAHLQHLSQAEKIQVIEYLSSTLLVETGLMPLDPGLPLPIRKMPTEDEPVELHQEASPFSFCRIG